MRKKKRRPDLSALVKTQLDGIGLLLDEMDKWPTEQLIQMILGANKVFVTGKGRSGLVAECFAMRLMQMGFDVHVPGEVTCPRIKKGDLMIAISCSGKTITTVQLLRIAQQAGIRVVAVTADAKSSLTSQADLVIILPVTGKDVKKHYRYVLGPYNNTLFEEALLLYFDAVVYSVLERKGISKKVLSDRHANLE